jgi:hypothetical protein
LQSHLAEWHPRSVKGQTRNILTCLLISELGLEERLLGEGDDPQPMFSDITAAQRVPHDHPRRRVRAMSDEALRALVL